MIKEIENYIKKQGHFDGLSLSVDLSKPSILKYDPDIKLTVLIPAYNEKDFIVRTLDMLVPSYQNANFKYRVVVVNNNSTDGTVEIVENYIKEKNLDNFYLLHENRKGSSSARKRGADEIIYCQSVSDEPHYVISCDSDQLKIPKGFVAQYYKHFTNNPDVYFVSGCRDIDGSQSEDDVKQFMEDRYELEYFFWKHFTMIDGGDWGFRLDKYCELGGIKVTYYYDDDEKNFYEICSDDYDLCYEMLMKGMTFDHIFTETLASGRKFENNIGVIASGELYTKDYTETKFKKVEVNNRGEQFSKELLLSQIRGFINRFMLHPMIASNHRITNFDKILGDDLKNAIYEDIELLKEIHPLSPYRIYESLQPISLIIYTLYGKDIFDRVMKINKLNYTDDYLNKKIRQSNQLQKILFADEEKFIKFQKAISIMFNVSIMTLDRYFLDT